MTNESEPVSRCGFAAIIGAPNAGKSTLVNRLVGQKIAIVTHKVQTTRARLRGIAIEGLSQIVFVDTPGIFAPRRHLDRAMVEAAWSGAGDADLVILLVDSRAGLNAEVEAILASLDNVSRPPVLALNKVDVVRPETLLALSQRLNERLAFAATFMISALSGSGSRICAATPPMPCRRGPGSIPTTRSPICRSGCSRPRSPARS